MALQMKRSYIIPKKTWVVREFNGIIDTCITTARCEFAHDPFYYDEDIDFLIFRWQAEYSQPYTWWVPKNAIQCYISLI